MCLIRLPLVALIDFLSFSTFVLCPSSKLTFVGKIWTENDKFNDRKDVAAGRLDKLRINSRLFKLKVERQKITKLFDFSLNRF